MATLRQAFPQAEWDVLTTNTDSKIDDENKQHPARWLAKLSSHYLGEEPLIQSPLTNPGPPKLLHTTMLLQS